MPLLKNKPFFSKVFRKIENCDRHSTPLINQGLRLNRLYPSEPLAKTDIKKYAELAQHTGNLTPSASEFARQRDKSTFRSALGQPWDKSWTRFHASHPLKLHHYRTLTTIMRQNAEKCLSRCLLYQ